MKRHRLTDIDLERYDRQILLPELGAEGQEKLKKAKTFIAGAGGLGCPVSLYLAAAGVGEIRLVDHERVELSNLNRQVLHWAKDIGREKVDSAREKLQGLNADVCTEAIAETITEDNVFQLVADYDLIIDAMDNFATRYLLNRVALAKNIPLFHGAVYGFEGRATTIIPGETACFRCLYREAPPPVKFPVIGVAPAVIGCIQATEVIKYIAGIGQLLTNRLLIYDGSELKFTELRIKRSPNCIDCAASVPG
jgi:adenylyltransferase/sulfurtransferase